MVVSEDGAACRRGASLAAQTTPSLPAGRLRSDPARN